jgi:hypothetical protein
MDNIWSQDSLLLFLVFFIPGFISQKVYGLIVPDETRDNSTFVTSAVAYSSLNYALALPLIWWLAYNWRGLDPVWLAAASVGIVLVLPVLLPLAWLRIRGLKLIKANTVGLTKRPWDFALDRRQRCWVIVTLKNGQQVAGIYGAESFASAFPHKEQIYLEKEWLLAPDGTFDREVNKTKGVIILGDEIMMVELFKS